MFFAAMLTAFVQAAPMPVPSPSSRGPQLKATPADQQESIDRLTHELEKIDRAVEDTKQMIRTSLDAPYLPDLYFHLAELYVQRSRFEHARGLEQQGDTGRNLGDQGSMIVTLSKRLAIETYEKIVTDFPDYDRKDQIYFFKGHEYRELGEWPLMFKEYNALIDKFPKSKWSMEARLILGDHHFDKGDYDEAEKFYQDMLEQPESNVHPMARYKLGWIRINQQKFKEALELFREAVITVDNAEKGKGKVYSTGKKNVNVKREALMAMAWPYSETRKPSKALGYFRELADSKQAYLDVLRKLANRYSIKSKTAAAAYVYREILHLSEESEEKLAYVPQVVNAVNDLPADKPQRYQSVEADVAGLTDTVQGILDRPEPVKRRPDAPPLDEKKLADEFEIHARDLATRAQKFAQTTQDKKLNRAAAGAYEEYIETFPKAREFETLELDRAGALFDAGDFLPAGEQYEKVASTNTGLKKARQNDLYNAILGYYRALDEDAKHRASDPQRNGILDKLELLKAREGLKQLGAFFIKKFPSSDKVPNVRFQVATMYYQQGEFQRSVELFTDFIKHYPTHKDVSTAGNLALDALFKLEKLDEMAILADAFAKDPRITNTDFKADAAKMADAARRRKVEYTVIGTADTDFSKKMVSEWEKHKGTKEGEQYLYAGFSKYKSQGDIANTFSFGDKLMGAYPNSSRAPEIVSTMGTYAAQIADFERAAFMYEEFQKRFSKEKAAVDLLKNAGEMRFLLGEQRQAEQDFTTLRQVGNSEQRSHATQRLLEMYAGASAWGQLAAAANSFLGDEKSVTACFYAGLAALKQGDERESRPHLMCAARGTAQNDGEEGLQARAIFELARGVHKNYEGIEFHGAASAEQVLGAKLKALGDTEQAYLAAVKSGDSQWAMAGTYELSRLYRDFGEFILNAPVPAGISAEEYKTALQGQADPYFDKGKQTLNACAQKAEQLKLLSTFGQACLAGANKEVDDHLGPPARAAVAQDRKYQEDLTKLRQGLAKNAKNGDALRAMAKRAMQVGDWHYARLVLGTLADMNAKGIEGWMGLVLWRLNEPQAAAEQLEKARQDGNDIAGLNLAALYNSFGYKRAAKQVIPHANKIQGIDLNSYEIHPAVRKLLNSGAASEPAPSEPGESP